MGNGESTPAESTYPGNRQPRTPPTVQTPQSRPTRPVNTEPGAFDVAGPRQLGQVRCRVRIPQGVRPGQHFPVMVESQQVMVRCPERANPGDTIEIQFQAHTFIVQVPDGVQPGQAFDVIVRGARQRVICPDGVRPGMQIRFSLPEDVPEPPPQPEQSPFEKLYEVVVPQGVRPGQPFLLMADGQRVTVTCPPNVQAGGKIRFKLPYVPTSEQLQAYEVRYNKDGWVRSLGPDLKFHWFRYEAGSEGGGAEGDGAPRKRFSMENTAYVRQLWGPEQALRLVAPADLAIETTVEGTRVNFQSLSRAATLPFDQKVEFFRTHIGSLRVPWDRGHIDVRVRRSNLLSDSLFAFEQVPKDGMRKIFRFEFLGEPGIDAGGVAREWFDQLTSALFNPDFGLFQYSGVDQMCMQINAASGLVETQHLRYFRMVGRILGKALFDGQLVRHHLVRPLYKHILAWPVVLGDLEHLDAETYANLGKLLTMENLEDLCLDFTVTENLLGRSETVPLVPDGANVTLTNDNVDEYLECNLRYRLCGRFAPQLREMLLGFYECVPEVLLSVFDFQQLELLLCGMPNIDIADWMRNTEYGGEFARQGQGHKVVQWFWEVIRDDFDQEQRARLLQFVTGTSGVPAQGFAFLQGNDGNIRRFTINSIPLEHSLYPRAHTCFNRIDLPLYKSKKDLRQHLSLAVQMESTGFDIE